MPVNVNYGILQPVDIGGAFQNAFQKGQQDRARSETKNALAALAQDPNADISDVAKYNPELVMQVNQRRAQEQQQRTIGDALTGNQAARNQVAYFDPNLYLKLQGEERKQAKEGLAAIAQVALYADTPEKWNDIVGRMGPEAAPYAGRFADREAIIAQAGQMQAYMEEQEPKIGYVPDGATAYSKNAAGESVLQALNGAQPQHQPQAQTVDKETGKQMVNGWRQAGYATRDQIEVIKASMGGNQQAVDQYIQSQGLAVVDAVKQGPDGREYYLINGKVYDNPRGE